MAKPNPLLAGIEFSPEDIDIGKTAANVVKHVSKEAPAVKEGFHQVHEEASKAGKALWDWLSSEEDDEELIKKVINR